MLPMEDNAYVVESGCSLPHFMPMYDLYNIQIQEMEPQLMSQFLLMPTLTHLLKEEKSAQVVEHEFLDLSIALCGGAVREMALIHADIKLSNMYWDGGRVLISGVEGIEQVGALVDFTPYYCHPVVQSSSKWTETADLYSLAVSFQEMITEWNLDVSSDVNTTGERDLQKISNLLQTAQRKLAMRLE